MNRMPAPEAQQAPPTAQMMYDSGWRPSYPPAFDSNAPDSRRASSASHMPVPPQSYPVMPNRELPHLPGEGPYTRPNSLPGPAHSPEINPSHPTFRPPAGSASHELSPHSAPPDIRSRMGYQHPEQPGNGDPAAAAGPLPSPSQFVPPMSAAGAAQYDPNFYQNAAFGSRQRKANRAQQACDQCRARKAKCDEGRPACSHCKENSLICVYKEVPPHKQEKSTQLLMDRLMQLEDRMEDRFSKQQAMHMDLVTFLYKLMGNGNDPSLKRDAARLLRDRPAALALLSDPLPRANAPDVLPPPGAQNESTPYPGQKFDPMNPSLDCDLDDNEGELSIPWDHTTAAHKLLMWPSIKRLLYPKEYDEQYVMELERERGLISVYGQGEISYSADDSRMASPPWEYDVSDWPDILKRLTPGGGGESEPQSAATSFAPDHETELDDVGKLMADSESVRRYHRSYLKHMHKLHPFLDQHELEWKIEFFIKCYCPDSDSNTPGPNVHRGAKRKRSDDSLGDARSESLSSANAAPRTSRPRIGRNIDNAIVLLVLAIGSICECKSPLPGAIMDRKPDFRNEQIPAPSTPFAGSHTSANGVLSPSNSDSAFLPSASLYALPPQDMSHSYPSPPPTDDRRRIPDRVASINRDGLGQPKNPQVIPGFAFYSYATAILGHLQGAIGILQVQAALLAGLYTGQLAHPFQSQGWIWQAARGCQLLVKSKTFERLEEGLVHDLYTFAYWTCLQLESDLLAELDVPASGISRLEGSIIHPKGYTCQAAKSNHAPNTIVMMYYLAQIHLRKVLNRVHTDLYKVEKKVQTRWSSSVQATLSMNLDLWRDSLPDSMRWKDTDPPSNDINAARMRAKYYGARYIIHRPLLYHALHFGQSGARIGSSQDASANSPSHMSPSMAHNGYRATAMARISSDLGTVPGHSASSFPNGWTPPNVQLRDLPRKLRMACTTCVESAILSTEAFDGIEDRLVVTNIFGTAHAQFGNMLVLSATYMSSLSDLVERSILERLLVRTIRFLLKYENVSPTLRADARILAEIYEKIFGHSPPVYSNSNHP